MCLVYALVNRIHNEKGCKNVQTTFATITACTEGSPSWSMAPSWKGGLPQGIQGSNPCPSAIISAFKRGCIIVYSG